MITVKYSSNNSGGDWWLGDDDWHRLEAEGWTVHWEKDDTTGFFSADKDGRWLGALARSAEKQFHNPEDGVGEWERITARNARDEGCNCCGQPHNFSYTDEAGGHHYLEHTYAAVRSSWS